MVKVPSQQPGVAAQQNPSAVNVYNHNMNGVDIADQYSDSYPFTRENIKWWRKCISG